MNNNVSGFQPAVNGHLYEVVAVRRESECPTETEVGTRFDLSNPHEPSHDLPRVSKRFLPIIFFR